MTDEIEPSAGAPDDAPQTLAIEATTPGNADVYALVLDADRVVLRFMKTNFEPEGCEIVDAETYAAAQAKGGSMKYIGGQIVDSAPTPPPPSTDPKDYPLKRWEFFAMVDVLKVEANIDSAIDQIEDEMERSIARARFRNSDVYEFADPLMTALARKVGVSDALLRSSWMRIVAARQARTA